MCNQSVGLIAAALERVGVATVCISLVRLIAERVRAPRTLVVPFPFGFPLGQPGDAAVQLGIMRTALALLREPPPPPLLREL